MPGDSGQLSIPAGGEVVEYDGEFHSPEVPIIPFAAGADGSIVSATRRVLDAAAEQMGRDICWLRVYLGAEARARYDVPIPRDTVRALRRFRLGLVGPLASTPRVARIRENELRNRVGLSAVVDRCVPLKGAPSPVRTGRGIDVTVFRDATEDAAAGLEYEPGAADTSKLREFLLETTDDTDRIPEGPAGYSVRPISALATQSLIDLAMEYALDRDRDVLTLVHQGDLLPASEGSFLDWARESLREEYGEATIDEATFDTEYNGHYPEDEVVITERRTDVVCRELLTNPDDYDVLVAPALGGTYVSAVSSEGIGGSGVTPGIAIGNGRLVATSRPVDETPVRSAGVNPIGTMLSGGFLFEYIGWMDSAGILRDAISATLADGHLPRDLVHRSMRGRHVTPEEFADAVIDRLDRSGGVPPTGGVQTTADERSGMKRVIAGIYNIVFEDDLSPRDIELNQLLHEDEEADIYLPEVGLNFSYWRRWPPERRLEVVLHEFAHIEETEDEPDHGDEFYDRFIELVDIAADRRSEVEELFGTSLDFRRLRRLIVESVHEETIEPDLRSIAERKRMLRDHFGLDGRDHY